MPVCTLSAGQMMQPRARCARAVRASCAGPAVRESESSRSATGAALAARRLPPLFFDLAGFSSCISYWGLSAVGMASAATRLPPLCAAAGHLARPLHLLLRPPAAPLGSHVGALRCARSRGVWSRSGRRCGAARARIFHGGGYNGRPWCRAPACVPQAGTHSQGRPIFSRGPPPLFHTPQTPRLCGGLLAAVALVSRPAARSSRLGRTARSHAPPLPAAPHSAQTSFASGCPSVA